MRLFTDVMLLKNLFLFTLVYLAYVYKYHTLGRIMWKFTQEKAYQGHIWEVYRSIILLYIYPYILVSYCCRHIFRDK